MNCSSVKRVISVTLTLAAASAVSSADKKKDAESPKKETQRTPDVKPLPFYWTCLAGGPSLAHCGHYKTLQESKDGLAKHIKDKPSHKGSTELNSGDNCPNTHKGEEG
jgi:hypothetical protein